MQSAAMVMCCASQQAGTPTQRPRQGKLFPEKKQKQTVQNMHTQMQVQAMFAPSFDRLP